MAETESALQIHVGDDGVRRWIDPFEHAGRGDPHRIVGRGDPFAIRRLPYRDLGEDLVRLEVDPGDRPGPSSSTEPDPCRASPHGDAADRIVHLWVGERDVGRDPRFSRERRDRARLPGGRGRLVGHGGGVGTKGADGKRDSSSGQHQGERRNDQSVGSGRLRM
jgi:hypothetical protein